MAIITGTNNRDLLNGTAGADEIYSYDGNDVIYGHGGDDVLYGGNGDDILYGGSGNDILHGGDGDDKFYGGSGNDIFYGGNGIDTVSYADYKSVDTNHWRNGVIVYLDNDDMGAENPAGADKYYSIENVEGSLYDDIIYGNSGDNIIWGNGGNDHLYGYSSEDYYNSYDDVSRLFSGHDIFYTGSRIGEKSSVYMGLGRNEVYGGEGNDYILREQVNWEDYMAYGQKVGSTILHLGEGDNYVNLWGLPGDCQMTAGSGNDRFSVYVNHTSTLNLPLLKNEISIDLGNGDNHAEFFYMIGNVEYLGGEDRDNFTFYGMNHFEDKETDLSLFISKIVTNLGNGHNSFQGNGGLSAFDVKTGHGNDNIMVTASIFNNRIIDAQLYQDIKIDAGNGNNDIKLYAIACGGVDVVAGDGDDSILVDEYLRYDGETESYIPFVAEDYSAERTIYSGEGEDTLYIREVHYMSIDSGSEADNISANMGSHLNIDAGSGRDKIYIAGLSESIVDAGSGHDEIILNGAENCTIKGGNGNDTYIWQSGLLENLIIDNYDTDRGHDILKLIGSLDDYTAEWSGDDLVIYADDGHDNLSSLIIQDCALGQDYQMDLFYIGDTSYDTNQFLAEMGLTL